jgi:imidazolonepropionase-like amidohydrolase
MMALPLSRPVGSLDGRVAVLAIGLLLVAVSGLAAPDPCFAQVVAVERSEPEVEAATEGETEAEERDEEEDPLAAPDRPDGEGEGPFERLIIRGVTMIDGTGAPPFGPVDIVIEGNRIAKIEAVGTPGLPFKEDDERPGDATHELDATGWYVMPGIVDLHAHTGGVPKAPEAEYVYKLWLAHGITTVRGVPTGGLEWALSEKARSAANQITAPRIVEYQTLGAGEEWEERDIRTPEEAREWVRYAHSKGVDGLKLFSHPPEIMEAVLDEARTLGMRSTAHLGQMGVAQMNALDAARLGLGGMTHFYGLFEALYDGHDVQPWPADINYLDEQDRFGQVARQWNLIHPRGSDEWNALIAELLELDFYINPTMTIYSAGRDVMRARNADWARDYVLPSLQAFFDPSRENHGAYWFDWTTWDEVAWRKFMQVWMGFLEDFKNRGGRVTVGSDSGFIYQTYGFGTILELELLQEAGFHPLEVIRAATMHGAMELEKASGEPIERGIIREGFLADLVLLEENPIHNLKVLYGTGAVRLDDETGETERIGGVRYTIKDGIVFDAQRLLADVVAMVEAQRAEMAAEGEAEAAP